MADAACTQHRGISTPPGSRTATPAPLSKPPR